MPEAAVGNPLQAQHSNKILTQFLSWYFLEKPSWLLHRYKEYAKALSEVFSIAFLLKTLFAPWKSLTDPYPKKGFDIGAILATFTFNIMTRLIGAVVRLATIFAGLFIQLCLLAGFLVYALFWIIFPALPVLAIFKAAVSLPLLS